MGSQDDDGRALIAYSSERNKVMHVARLTRDFTDVESGYARTMVSWHCTKHAVIIQLWVLVCVDSCGSYIKQIMSKVQSLPVAAVKQRHPRESACDCKDFWVWQVGMSREAPAMFKHGDIYLMVTSGCTGWLANRAEVFYARQAASYTLASDVSSLQDCSNFLSREPSNRALDGSCVQHAVWEGSEATMTVRLYV